MHPVSFERHLEAGSGCGAAGTEGPVLGRSAERSQAGDGCLPWPEGLYPGVCHPWSRTCEAGCCVPAREALPSPCRAVPLHLRVLCSLPCLPSEGTQPWWLPGLGCCPSLSPAVPAEAGAEASGSPGTANAVKAPLNRAEQEGALGRRPGLRRCPPGWRWQCPHCPRVPCPEPRSDLAGAPREPLVFARDEGNSS